MLGNSNKTAAEVQACFDLMATDISDLGCSEWDGGSVPSQEGKFPMSFWYLVSGLWSLVSGLWSLVSGLWSLVSGLWI